MGPKFVIVGLGNPGNEYSFSLHNVGFRVIDILSRDLSIRLSAFEHKGRLGLGRFREHSIMLVKPLTFMNNSGKCISGVTRKYGLDSRHLLVIHDDMDIEMGRIRIKTKGASGGHRGVQSIIEHLGSEDFGRIKIGIGRPPEGIDPKEYVLRPAGYDKTEVLEQSLKQAVQATYEILINGYASAMNLFNSKSCDGRNGKSSGEQM